MSLIATDAVVLHVQDYLESYRIVRMATREHGVQSVLARGARRPRSKFGSSLDLFASGVAQFTLKPGRDLSNLSGFDLTRSRMGLAADLDRFAGASALAELALRFAHADADPHDDAFDVLGRSFDEIVNSGAGESTDVAIAAAWRYVAALGFGPTLDRCCSCGSEVSPDRVIPFSHHGGGVVCAKCTRTVPNGRDLPADARAAIAAWLAHDTVSALGDLDRRAHLRLLREFLHHHMGDGRALRALDGWEARLRKPA
jgi:DNA repair protein RecO (recombination protein O)